MDAPPTPIGATSGRGEPSRGHRRGRWPVAVAAAGALLALVAIGVPWLHPTISVRADRGELLGHPIPPLDATLSPADVLGVHLPVAWGLGAVAAVALLVTLGIVLAPPWRRRGAAVVLLLAGLGLTAGGTAAAFLRSELLEPEVRRATVEVTDGRAAAPADLFREVAPLLGLGDPSVQLRAGLGVGAPLSAAAGMLVALGGALMIARLPRKQRSDGAETEERP